MRKVDESSSDGLIEAIIGLGILVIGGLVLAAAVSSGSSNAQQLPEPKPVPEPKPAATPVVHHEVIVEDSTTEEYSGMCMSCGRSCGGTCGTGDFYHG